MPSRYEKELDWKGTRLNVADMRSNVAIIVSHPWSILGGNRHNNVVVAAALYFQRLGVTTLRFDFQGSGIGRGYGQVEQVQELAQGLLKGEFSADRSNKPSKIILIGYSYGSLITGSASADIDDCIASISIAPPFSVQHWLLMFNSSYHLNQATSRERLPRLLLIGTEDNFTSEHAFKETIDANYPSEYTTGAVLKQADHFFHRREKDVMDVIGQWLLETFPQCNGDLKKLGGLFFGLAT